MKGPRFVAFGGIVLFWAFLSHINVNAQDNAFDANKLDSYFNAIQSQWFGSVCVSKDGKTVFQKSVGYADVDARIEASPDSRYLIGSISKMFTSYLVLSAVDEGLLSLSDNLSKYFPDSKIENADSITIDNLLYHRSGIHDVFEGGDDYLEWNTKPHTREQLLEKIASAKSDFTPNADCRYCNSGYVLLTFILEKVYGKSFADLLQERIAKPLNLQNTYYGGKIDPSENECRSYTYEGDWNLEPETDLSIPQGAGALVSTPSDLTKFAYALFTSEFGAKVVDRMKTVLGPLGRGLFPIPFYARIGFGHTGGIDGFSSVLCHFDDDDVVVAVCSNASDFNQNDILIAILNTVYGIEYEIPSFTCVELSAEQLESYTGVYSSEALHMDLTITTNGKILYGQATGQTVFALTSKSDGQFECLKAGLVIDIDVAERKLTLYQGGGKFEFLKK